MTQFEPIGEVARWKVCYDFLRKKDINKIVEYEQFEELLDKGATRTMIQQAVRRAADELLETDNKTVDSVRGIGYRIVAAHEHLDLARRDQRKSNKALTRGHKLVTHVDLNQVHDPEIRKAFGIVAQAFMMQREFNRRTDVRQQHLEKALKKVEDTGNRTREEVDELKERLKRLENKS